MLQHAVGPLGGGQAINAQPVGQLVAVAGEMVSVDGVLAGAAGAVLVVTGFGAGALGAGVLSAAQTGRAMQASNSVSFFMVVLSCDQKCPSGVRATTKTT